MPLIQRSSSVSCSFPAVITPWQKPRVASCDSASPRAFTVQNTLSPPRPAPTAPQEVIPAHNANILAPLRPDRVHTGNPQQGTLLVLAQMHRTTDPNNPLAQSPAIARSQAIILEALLRVCPQTVFFEGHYSAMDPAAIDAPIKDAMQKAFAHWRGHAQGLNPAQAELLRQYGADVAYACLAKEPVQLPITEDPRLLQHMAERLQAGAVFEEEAAKLHVPRDKHFAAVLGAHFKAHPGATAIFVVGGAHDLIRQCHTRTGFDPQLLWYNTTGIPAATLAEQQDLVYSEAH